jgi:hypothetical protein
MADFKIISAILTSGLMPPILPEPRPGDFSREEVGRVGSVACGGIELYRTMVDAFNHPQSPTKLVDGPPARKDQPPSREARETEDLWIVAAYLTAGMLPPVPEKVYTEITNWKRTSKNPRRRIPLLIKWRARCGYMR